GGQDKAKLHLEALNSLRDGHGNMVRRKFHMVVFVIFEHTLLFGQHRGLSPDAYELRVRSPSPVVSYESPYSGHILGNVQYVSVCSTGHLGMCTPCTYQDARLSSWGECKIHPVIFLFRT